MLADTTNPSAVQEVDVAIVGAGFGGLCTAIKLREAGIENFVVLEKSSNVGGTWNFNRYPGAACDVQSHMYSFSFEGNPNWSRRYAGWEEILDYIQRTTDKYGIRPFIKFNQEVSEAVFDEKTARWRVGTKTGLTLSAKHVVLATGPLHIPAMPNIRGIENFKGKMFHSAQWDQEYDLRGKRVASIGTGGSAVQYLPEIAPQVKQLYAFQRSAAWVIPRDDRKYLGIQKQLFDKVPLMRKAHRARIYWSNEARLMTVFSTTVGAAFQKLATGYIHLQVKDKEIAKKLTPDYTMGCKRILVSNKYYPTFNRENVELVTEGIQEIRENSIVTKDGVEREIDCLILGTGFVVDPRIYMRNFPVVGLGGRKLHEDWKEAAQAYYGTTIAGYPNFYQLVGPNSGLGHNSIIFMIESQVHYILECLKLLKDRRADYLHVRSVAQRTFNKQIQRSLKESVWASGCTSWYQQDDGINTALWPYATWRYWYEMRSVKERDYQFGRAKS